MDHTAQLQELLDQTGTIVIPAGTYNVNAEVSLKVKSNSKVDMSKAILKAIPNDKEKYCVLLVDKADNVTITGGEIIGERDQHTGKDGQWGFGIRVRESSNVTVIGVKSSKCWGDGFYVGNLSKNVKFEDCIADNNRRQGLSVVECDGIVVKNSKFLNTKGTAPQSGIDLEPDRGTKWGVKNVLITGCRFEKNAGHGIAIDNSHGGVTKGRIENCTFVNNGSEAIRCRNVLNLWMKLLWDIGWYRPTSLVW